MRPVFCFIDDADFELDNFRENAASAYAGVRWILAKNWRHCLEQLAGAKPFCFLLDLYGNPGELPGQMPAARELTPLMDSARSLESIMDGHAVRDPDPANRTLRELHGEVARWQKVFLAAAQRMGQSTEFGLGNLARVRERFPFATALGYSRKALYRDAHDFTLAGGDGLLQKPQGQGDQAIAKATREGSPALARAVFKAVDHRLAARAGFFLADLAEREGLAELRASVARCLNHFAKQGKFAFCQGNQTDAAKGRLEDHHRQLLETLSLWDVFRNGSK